MADAADRAWTIAMATGGAPLPLRSPPLRHRGGGLNVAARYILLALYLNHCDLHLPDPQQPALRAPAPPPEAWAGTAPEEVADWLRITCRRSNTALGRQKGTPQSAHSSTRHTPPQPRQLRSPESWASFWDAHLAAPSETTAARMDPEDQRAYVRGLEACLREAHHWHTRSPSPPRGQGGSPAPDTQQAKKTKTGQRGRQRARQQGTAPRPGPRPSPAAPPHSQSPGAHQQHHPHQRPPPRPYRSTLTRQPGQGPLARTHPYHRRTTIHAGPGNMAPPAPRPQPPDAPILQRPQPAPSPPCPSAAGPQGPPFPRGAPARTAALRVPRAHLPQPPTLTTVSTSAVVPHTANTPSQPPPHGPAPRTAPTAQARNIQATIRPHRPAGGHARAQTAPGPRRSIPPPPAAPQPATHANKHHPPAATRCIRTTAPPGSPGSHLPPVPRHRSKQGTATTARHAHATPTQLGRTPRLPLRTAPTPAPPAISSATHTPSPPRPPPRDQATDAPLQDPHQPPSPPAPPRHTPPRGPPPVAAKGTSITRPHTQQRRPPPPTHTTPITTPCTTSRRIGRTLRPTQPASGTAAPPGPRRPGGATPPHLRQHTQRIWAAILVQAATLEEGFRDFLFDAFLHVARHGRPPLGRNVPGHPVPGLMDTKGCTPYHEPTMADPPPSATPAYTKAWKREIWVDRMASLSNFRDHVPGDLPIPDGQQPAPSTHMTLMYNIHYTLSTTHYHAPTGTWVVHGTDSLLPVHLDPPPRTTRPPTRTPERTSRTTPTSGAQWSAGPWRLCSSSAAPTRTLARRCIALPNGPNGPGTSPRSGGCGRSNCVPSKGRPPRTAWDPPPAPHHPATLPVHGGSPPHDPAVAGPRHPHQKLPPPHGRGHAEHPVMLLQHPRLPPASATILRGAEVDPSRITHLPAQPR